MPDPTTKEILKLVFETEGEGKVIQASKKLAKTLADREKADAKAAKRTHIDAKKTLKETEKQRKVDMLRLKDTKTAAATAERSAMKLLGLQKRLIAASDSEAKWLRKRIDLEKERYQVSLKGLKAREKAAMIREHGTTAAAVEATAPKSPAAKAGEDVEAFKEFISYDWSKSGADMFEGFSDGIQSLSGRDFAGAIKGIAKGLGSGIKGVGAGVSKKVAAGAAGTGPMASIFKAIQPLIRSMGPMLNTLAKMAPLLSTMSQLVIGIVKLFIDAEAAAKDLNKEFLEASGTGQFFYRGLKDAGAAANDLDVTLTNMRNAATSLDNLQWGITKDTFAGTVKALNAEGVSLTRIEDEFKNVSTASKDAAGYAKDWGSMVQMSVAYSRAFGVSLNEISALQGEMMTEMGMGLTSVEKSFDMMAKGADEAGIASNKFFGIIRGVSADLSLYNTRMEDAVHMLTMLGKVMSPKNASKFLQSSMQAVKNMGRTERLKVALLSGGKGAAVVDRDIKRHSQNLAQKISDALGGSMDPATIAAAVNKGGSDFTDIIAKLPKEMQGEMREAGLELQLKKGMAKGGVFGKGLAMGETGPAAQLEVLTQALKGFNGGQSLMDGIGSLGEQMMAENLGISIEQLNSMAKFEVAMKDQRDTLKNTMEKGTEEQKKDLKLRLKKLGIITEKEMEDNAAVVSKINNAGYDQIMDTLDEDTKKQLTDSGKQIDYQKQTSDFQVSLMDRLGILIDFLMNQVYNIFVALYDTVSGMWDDLADALHIGDAGARAQKKMFHALEKASYESKDKRIMEAIRESGGDVWKARDKMIAGAGADWLKGLDDSHKEWSKLSEDIKTESDPKKKAAMQARIDELSALKTKDISNAVKHMTKPQAVAALKDAGRQFPKLAQAAADYESGSKSWDQVMEGLSSEEINAFLGKSMWAIPPEELAKMLPGMQVGKTKGQVTAAAISKDSSTVVGAGAPPNAQQQAAANTATQGTGGTAVTTTAATPPPVTSGGGGAPPAAGGGGSWLPDYGAMIKQQGVANGQNEDQIAALTESGSTLADIYKVLRIKGVRMDWKYHHDDYEKLVEKGVLEGERQALFEYFLYSKLNEDVLQDAVKRGMKPGDIAASALDQLSKGTKLGDIKAVQAPGNALGGTVLPAPGELLASVAPGERILPAGAGGGTGVKVVLELKGDMLNQIIKAKATEAAVEHDRRKKFSG